MTKLSIFFKFWTMHGGVRDHSCCAFIHRVAFKEVSGPTTLSNSLMSFSIFWRYLQDFLCIQYHAIYSDSFASSFQIWIPFISFSCLIVMARTSKIMLNKSGDPCLVPDLRGNAFSFSLLGMMLVVGLSYLAFIMLRYVHSMPTFLRFFFFLS